LLAVGRWVGLAAVVAAGLASLVGSGGGGGGAGDSVVISGTADFESVPSDSATNGRLLYGSIANRPIRGATVQVIAASGGTVLATGTTSATGAYSLSLTGSQSVIVRVRAELKKDSGNGGTWDFSVRDNTQGDGLYVLDSAAFTPATGSNTRNVRATSGWGGASYTSARLAAPFAILDTVYDASQKVLSARPNAAFPALQLMWSVSNRPAGGGTPAELAQGLIPTTFYQFTSTGGHRIYILGREDTDTDEYDRAVVAHEFGHYLQSAFSRDDSIGGSHATGDRLDLRVAFAEGWGNAWAGMALATQFYTDSSGPGQQSGFVNNLAANPATNRGWFSEASVQYLMFQWHANAGIGFTPIFDVLANMPVTLPADATVSSLHSFAHHLKQRVPGQAGAIDSLLTGQLITVVSPQGTGEVNSGGIAEALPLYRTHSAGFGVAQNYCLTDAAGTASGEFNKAGATLFIRFTLATAATRIINVAVTTPGVASDPDFVLYRNTGAQTAFETEALNTESSGNVSLPAGTHLIELYDFELTRGVNAGTNNGQRCFNVTIL
jgi:hypothetical protein